MQTVFLNGQYLEKDQATISIFDRGFLFADSVYEVIPYVETGGIGVIPHIRRLNNSLKAIGMTPVYEENEWLAIFNKLQIKNNLSQQPYCIYIQVSRGDTGHRAHAIPHNSRPTVVAFCTPKPTLNINNSYSSITLEDTRHRICAIKSTNLLSNILLYEQAKKQGAIDAILYRNQEVVECCTSNVFCVSQGIILTPPLTPYMLAGITRSSTISTIKQLQLPFKEDTVTLDTLTAAEEIWITSSSKHIAPITTLDGKPVGNGDIGPITRTIQQHPSNQTKITE